MIALLFALPAQADEAPDWHLWSWSSIEAGPDDLATERLRAEERVTLDVDFDGFELGLSGAVQDPWVGAAGGELHRLHLGYRGQGLRADLGRQVRLGALGLQHIDGFTLDGAVGPGLRLSTWGGRLWHPETWSPGSTWVLGAELASAPGQGGRVGGAGYELRLADGDFAHRLHGFTAVQGPAGARASLQAEVEPVGSGDLSGRAALFGSTPIGRAVDAGLRLRWEGLEPETVPTALDSPMDWLADEDYGAADLDAVAHTGALSWTARGGPTWRPGEADGLGGSGRAGLSVQVSDPVSVGVAAVGATAGDSHVLGGLVDASLQVERLRLLATVGDFRFQPLAGPRAWVWEGRLRAEGQLPVGGGGRVRELGLAAELAAGADRVLEPWVRGGLALRVDLGRDGQEPW